MKVVSTSRSAIEAYTSVCQRKRYLSWHVPIKNETGELVGQGLQPAKTSLDLVFGSAVHLGIEKLFQGQSFDDALNCAQDYYLSEIKTGAVVDSKVSQEHEPEYLAAIEEHGYLIEALLYGWYVSEFQILKSEFEVILAEQELENTLGYYDGKPIVLQTRVDALLLHKASQELQTYSIKTTKMLGIFTRAMQNTDLQGYLEIWGTEQWLEKLRLASAKFAESLTPVVPKQIRGLVIGYLNKKLPIGINRVDRVRFCFLVKGDRKQDDQQNWYRDNRYLYGYRKANGDGSFSYAHSWYYQNLNNKSGKGALGKSWEKFPVWAEYEGGIRQWIDDINLGNIQPDAMNPLGDIINIPEPVVRVDNLVERTVASSTFAELEVLSKLDGYFDGKLPDTTANVAFAPNYKSCFWPMQCEFHSYCYNPHVTEDPLASGLYQIRVNHHSHQE